MAAFFDRQFSYRLLCLLRDQERMILIHFFQVPASRFSPAAKVCRWRFRVFEASTPALRLWDPESLVTD
jgi:transposase-like protein